MSTRRVGGRAGGGYGSVPATLEERIRVVGFMSVAGLPRAALRAKPVPGLKEVIALTEDGLGHPFRP